MSNYAGSRLTAGPGRDVPVLGTGWDQAFFHIPGPSHTSQRKPGPGPISNLGFPVPSCPIPGTGPGRDGKSRLISYYITNNSELHI